MIFFHDFRELLKEILGDVDAVIPDHLDQITLWKIILNMVSEPPRRKKLANVNTLQDVVELIRNSKKIIILTGNHNFLKYYIFWKKIKLWLWEKSQTPIKIGSFLERKLIFKMLSVFWEKKIFLERFRSFGRGNFLGKRLAKFLG